MSVDRKHEFPFLLTATVLVLVCVICPTESITLESEGSLDGQWKIQEGSVASLKCTIPSFTSMNWKLDSSIAASCSVVSCQQTSTGNGVFTFGFDTANGIFYWNLNPVEMKYNNMKFECFDGTNSKNFTATVTKKDYTPNTEAISITALVFALVGFAGGIAIGVVVVFLRVRFNGLIQNGAEHVA